jgi:ribonuclease BN (tRNA processing enzyme)
MDRDSVTRRRFLKFAAASAGVLPLSRFAFAQNAEKPQKGAKLILLGTKGGPRVGGERSNPASVVVVDGVPYVIDCGQGVSRQLVNAGIPLNSLRNIFITHMHSDHNLEYGGLLYNAWATGLRNTVQVYGPPTLESMTRAFFDYMKFDIETRIEDEGRPDLRKMVKTQEIAADGLVMQDERVKVTAARNIHPPIEHSYALRFDTRNRSIVMSGDTNYSEKVVALARGADVLVHEILYPPGIETILKRAPNAATLREHLLASHTAPEDVGRVAAAAGVKTLVLTHFVPGDDPSITDAMWTDGVRKHFSGEIIVGKDLMVI